MTLNKLIENRPMLDDMAKAAARQYKADATKKVADALQAVSR
jgi:uncharacterized membrane protein